MSPAFWPASGSTGGPRQLSLSISILGAVNTRARLPSDREPTTCFHLLLWNASWRIVMRLCDVQREVRGTPPGGCTPGVFCTGAFVAMLASPGQDFYQVLTMLTKYALLHICAVHPLPRCQRTSWTSDGAQNCCRRVVVFVDEANGDLDNIPSDGDGLDGDDETSDESEEDSDVRLVGTRQSSNLGGSVSISVGDFATSIE